MLNVDAPAAATMLNTVVLMANEAMTVPQSTLLERRPVTRVLGVLPEDDTVC